MGPYDGVVSMIGKLIKDETKFLGKRMGIVSKVDDPNSLGRILVHIPSFGWDTDDKGAWCYPTDKAGLVTPQKGDYVIVEFLDGNRDLPLYTGVDYRLKGMLPSGYDGKPTTQVLYEDNAGEVVVKYDESAKTLTVSDSHGNTLVMDSGGISLALGGTEISLNGKTKAFVTHTELDTALQGFVNGGFNSHIHTAPSGPTTPPVAPGSIDISSAATTTVKTGG